MAAGASWLELYGTYMGGRELYSGCMGRSYMELFVSYMAETLPATRHRTPDTGHQTPK